MEVQDLKKKIRALTKVQEQYSKTQHDLGERVKELRCLYGIAKLIEEHSQCVDDVFQGTVDLIPCSWQYPGVTCARIIFKEKKFVTAGFRRTKWRQAAAIYANKIEAGVVEVYYTQKMPPSAEGPFLKEERALINGVAERLGRFIEHGQAIELLQESQRLLREKNESLQNKNIALQELLAQFEQEKRHLADKVVVNAQRLLIPLVERLEKKQVAKRYIALLQDSLKALTSDFGPWVTSPRYRLSLREIEVCHLVKRGLSSKQIARLLRLSLQTIESYRRSIRQKLGITAKGVNLASFLQECDQ